MDVRAAVAIAAGKPVFTKPPDLAVNDVRQFSRPDEGRRLQCLHDLRHGNPPRARWRDGLVTAGSGHASRKLAARALTRPGPRLSGRGVSLELLLELKHRELLRKRLEKANNGSTDPRNFAARPPGLTDIGRDLILPISGSHLDRVLDIERHVVTVIGFTSRVTLETL